MNNSESHGSHGGHTGDVGIVSGSEAPARSPKDFKISALLRAQVRGPQNGFQSRTWIALRMYFGTNRKYFALTNDLFRFYAAVTRSRPKQSWLDRDLDYLKIT